MGQLPSSRAKSTVRSSLPKNTCPFRACLASLEKRVHKNSVTGWALAMLAPLVACATPQGTQMPLTEPTTERIVRLVSVHGGETDWVPTQAAMLVRHVDLPFRLYTTVRDGQINHVSETWQRITGDEPAFIADYSTAMKAAKKWHGTARCVLSAAISCDHAVQLEYLMSEAVRDALADDVLLVLDSDAWPVASLREHVLPLIDGGNDVELVAVRRAVEGMALWPHPSFAVTTCGLWVSSYHSWGLAESLSDVVHHGFTRKLQQQVGEAHVGRTCHSKEYEIDTGAMLWGSYNDSLSRWSALDRVNALNLDPLFYGVYGRNGVALVYHEGAGTTQRSKSKVQPVTGGTYDDAFRDLRLAVAAAREDNTLHEPMDRLVELLVRPETSPLRWGSNRTSDLLTRCEATREQLLIAATVGGQRSSWCQEQVEDLCRTNRNRTTTISQSDDDVGTRFRQFPNLP